MENRAALNIMRFSRFLAILIIPGGLIVLAAYLSTRYSLHLPWLGRIEQIAPYAILGIGILLGWRFHRSRLALVIFILFLSERSLYYFGPDGHYSIGRDFSIILANSVLLPMNMALFYLVKERGIFNLRGISRIIFILLQPFAVFLLLRLQPDLFQHLFRQFINHPVLDPLPLPQLVFLIYGLVTLIFLSGALAGRGGPIMRGFFWAPLRCVSSQRPAGPRCRCAGGRRTGRAPRPRQPMPPHTCARPSTHGGNVLRHDVDEAHSLTSAYEVSANDATHRAGTPDHDGRRHCQECHREFRREALRTSFTELPRLTSSGVDRAAS